MIEWPILGWPALEPQHFLHSLAVNSSTMMIVTLSDYLFDYGRLVVPKG